jgi:hypothetical protein
VAQRLHFIYSIQVGIFFNGDILIVKEKTASFLFSDAFSVKVTFRFMWMALCG